MGASVTRSVSTAFGYPDDLAAEGEVTLPHRLQQWEGFGCSLGWLGKAVGSSSQADAWADLLFLNGDLETKHLLPHLASPYMPVKIPGLGLTVARYNVGGAGRRGENLGEVRSPSSRGWHAEIEGHQPSPGNFDWDRDAEQRRFLHLAVERGVSAVELYFNAPMWWMTCTSSSFGGTLKKKGDFAVHIAEVTAQACQKWQLPVRSVAPFNEPTAGWWKFPKDQEGCGISCDDQVMVINRLHAELQSRNLGHVLIATSDENCINTAISTWTALRRGVQSGVIGRINMHAYCGLSPLREDGFPGQRAALQQLAESDDVSIWMSEHGTPDIFGLELAQTIMEDLNHLQPTAWCYWQPIEHNCSWGMIEADFGDEPVNGSPKSIYASSWPHPKHYVFAHFTRFIRPGATLLKCSVPWAVAASSTPNPSSLAVVVMNDQPIKRTLTLRLPLLKAAGQIVQAVMTQPKARRLWVNCMAEVVSGDDDIVELVVWADEESICSVVIGSLTLDTL